MPVKQSTEGPLAVEAKNLGFAPDGVPVLRTVTFSIPDRGYVGLIGPNGGGKTTLVKLIIGLLQPTSGTVRVYGDPPAEARLRAGIGYVPQRIAQAELRFPATVEEIVWTGRTAKMRISRPPSDVDRQAIERAMQIAGVTDLRSRQVDELSGGERQKVFIARSLAAEPRILILDEPTTAVDIQGRERFYEFLRELNQKFGLTIIFVSHDIDVITREAESILCLNQTLICDVPSHSFDTKRTIELLYGSDTSPVHHHH